MPTLADVARIAGVGIPSVSRVVNGSRKVSKDTEVRVRAAIQKIGYQPNEAARILKGQRTRILGLIVPDLADPFFAICANTIQEAAREAGYVTMMVASGHQVDVERQQAEIMMQRQIAGLIIIPTSLENGYLAKAMASGLHVVALDRPLENVASDAVLVDNREASTKLVEHLVTHGHREILCVTDEERIFTKQERLRAYNDTMRKANLSPKVCIIGPTNGTVAEQLPALLSTDPKPTAIFAASDVLAVEVLQQLSAQQVRIPDEMALVAFDEFDAATLVTPTVTVASQPVIALGRKTVELLLQRIEGKQKSPPRHVVLQAELIIRESCGCGIQEVHSKRKRVKPPTRKRS